MDKSGYLCTIEKDISVYPENRQKCAVPIFTNRLQRTQIYLITVAKVQKISEPHKIFKLWQM